ncbi:hypothetical protein JMJ35_008122 [Cladonia borealis]|uniref:Ubiquitin-like domain-containing protein n=1 Tax=Cladonia borealis TaxID=184061 RepID=A0AA39UZA9_9LECA|nr:hypothetical protein JMJ35_008122 [Cladonia borealis]
MFNRMPWVPNTLGDKTSLYFTTRFRSGVFRWILYRQSFCYEPLREHLRLLAVFAQEFVSPVSEPHGLIVLYPPEIPAFSTPPELDIVAVHGLNGQARTTWQDPESKSVWLKDFLPHALPNSRIMTFGYDSALGFSRDRGGVESFAKDLLNRLRMIRVGLESQERPIIFIAHSLGGIVVKKALVLAHEAEVFYGNIVNSTKGVVFLGTPHGGSKLAAWGTLLSNVVNSVTFGQAVRKDLLKNLERDSAVLEEISRQFVQRAESLQIMSFYETKIERHLRCLVVPGSSAILNLHNELTFPLYATHRDLCRYDSERNQNYLLVESAIKEIGLPKAASPHDTTMARHEGTGKGMDSLQRNAPGNDKMITIQMVGLKHRISSPFAYKGTFSDTLQLHAGTQLDDIPSILLKKFPDLKYGGSQYRFSGRQSPIFNTWRDVFTEPVQVAADEPCYSRAKGYKIHAKQTLADFFSRAFPQVLEARLSRSSTEPAGKGGPSVSDAIAIGTEHEPHILIHLMRTIRMPRDEKVYSHPPGLGSFPLYDMQPFESRLLADLATRGGIFLPMYHREAMWISFDCPFPKNYAIRPYLGGINGISGEPTRKRLTTASRKLKTPIKKQDYLVLPGQVRLDGFLTESGFMKQFVATQRVPSSYQVSKSRAGATFNMDRARRKRQDSSSHHGIDDISIEWQTSGKGDVGGIQLQIIPEHDVEHMRFSNTPDHILEEYGHWHSYIFPASPNALSLDLFKTPSEQNIDIGDTVHVKNTREMQPQRQKTVRDLWFESPYPLDSTEAIRLDVFHEAPSVRKIAVHQNAVLAPTYFEFDTDDHFWEVMHVIRSRMPESSLQHKQAGLYMTHVVANLPNHQMPIATWNDILYFGDMQLAKWHGDEESAGCRDASASSAVDLFWGYCDDTSLPGILCQVDVRKSGFPTSGDVSRMLLAVPEGNKISDLCQMIRCFTDQMTTESQICIRNGPPIRDIICIGKPEYSPYDIDIPEFRYGIDRKGLAFEVRDRLLGFHIFVKDLRRQTYIIDNIESSDTIFDLKRRVKESSGVPTNQIRLIFAEEELEVYKLRGGAPAVDVRILDKIVRFWFIEISSIISLKQEIRTKTGIPPERQILSFEGKVLGDDYSLHEYVAKIVDLTIIPDECAVRLGVGAGGLISQHLEPDENNPRIWDVANSKMLNVQIVNSNDFYVITGNPPPPTPVDVQTYRTQDVPFMDDYTETTSEQSRKISVKGTSGKAEDAFEQANGESQVPLPLFNPGHELEGENASSEDAHAYAGTREIKFQSQELGTRIEMMDVDITVPPFESWNTLV